MAVERPEDVAEFNKFVTDETQWAPLPPLLPSDQAQAVARALAEFGSIKNAVDQIVNTLDRLSSSAERTNQNVVALQAEVSSVKRTLAQINGPVATISSHMAVLGQLLAAQQSRSEIP